MKHVKTGMRMVYWNAIVIMKMTNLIENTGCGMGMVTRIAYDYRSMDVLEMALFHTMGKLPEPKLAHKFLKRRLKMIRTMRKIEDHLAIVEDYEEFECMDLISADLEDHEFYYSMKRVEEHRKGFQQINKGRTNTIIKSEKIEMEYYEDNQKRLQGEFKCWHKNSQLKSHCHYVDGELKGEFKQWHDNGQLEKLCYYEDGKLNGEYKEWYENGQMECLYHYESGNQNGESKDWYENGQMECLYHYKDGKPNGEYRVWHDNGQLETHCHYRDGKFNGEYKVWYDNGQLGIHSQFVDGNMIADTKVYNRNGTLDQPGWILQKLKAIKTAFSKLFKRRK